MRNLVLSIVVFLSLSSRSLGDEWKVDKAHSKVYFIVKHLVISEVVGFFREFDITVTASKEEFNDMRVEAVLPVRSISTEVERRDAHLKSDDFFNAEKFPEIRFKSTKVEKVDENIYNIHGDLTIRDVTRPVVFRAVHNGTIKSAEGVRAGWKATATINRFDYGLKWNRLTEAGGLVVGDTVNIVVDLEITRPPES